MIGGQSVRLWSGSSLAKDNVDNHHQRNDRSDFTTMQDCRQHIQRYLTEACYFDRINMTENGIAQPRLAPLQEKNGG